MNDFLPSLPRWKDHADQANWAERAAGKAIRSIHKFEPLPASQVACIAANIRAQRSKYSRFWIMATATLILGLATGAFASHLDVLPGWLTRIVKPKSTMTVPHEQPSGKVRRTTKAVTSMELPSNGIESNIQVGPPLPDMPLVEPTAVSPTVGHGAVLRAITRPATPTPKPASFGRPQSQELPSPSSGNLLPPAAPIEDAPKDEGAPSSGRSRITQLAWMQKQVDPGLDAPVEAAPKNGNGSNSSQETKGVQGVAKHLTKAIRALRIEHSPNAALAILDLHAAELDKSAYRHESLILRVEAMLALHRQREVLRLLDKSALADVAASRTLLVTRGKLRAAANRCNEAVGDFDLVLAEAKPLDRQALFGRAVCRKKLGDGTGARTDLERFRREFPGDPQTHDLEKQIATSP
jgi:hypothetical protein